LHIPPEATFQRVQFLVFDRPLQIDIGALFNRVSFLIPVGLAILYAQDSRHIPIDTSQKIWVTFRFLARVQQRETCFADLIAFKTVAALILNLLINS
jgi:hypothetical protein